LPALLGPITAIAKSLLGFISTSLSTTSSFFISSFLSIRYFLYVVMEKFLYKSLSLMTKKLLIYRYVRNYIPFYNCIVVKKEVKIDGKGRILIPKELRDKLDLHEGDVLKVYVRGASIILKKSSKMKENPYRVLSKMLSGVTLDRISAEREAVKEVEKGTS
jgi:AbrB family looped-hinge helix DNA binding protein